MDSLLAADSFAVTSAATLDGLYAEPAERVKKKVITRLDDTARRFIAASPFCVLATSSRRGLRATPRGDSAGFVAVLDDHTLALPDRRGNNRIEALRDIVETGQVALLFLVPGSNESLRINARATVTTDPALCGRFVMRGVAPVTVILIAIEEIYMQCGRAVLRAGLWSGRTPPADLPSAGEMLSAHTGGLVEAAEYDATVYSRAMQSLY